MFYFTYEVIFCLQYDYVWKCLNFANSGQRIIPDAQKLFHRMAYL